MGLDDTARSMSEQPLLASSTGGEGRQWGPPLPPWGLAPTLTPHGPDAGLSRKSMHVCPKSDMTALNPCYGLQYATAGPMANFILARPMSLRLVDDMLASSSKINSRQPGFRENVEVSSGLSALREEDERTTPEASCNPAADAPNDCEVEIEDCCLELVLSSLAPWELPVCEASGTNKGSPCEGPPGGLS